MNLDQVERLLHRLPIRDKRSQRLVPFHFTPGQRKVHQALQSQQSKRLPMRVVVLKSRRQGISSYTEALDTMHCLSREATQAMIVTHKYKSSEALFSVPKTLLNEYLPGRPPLGKVLGLPTPTQHKITFPHRNGDSVLSIATAGNVEGGRGMTLTDLHLSEVAFYASEASFAALMPTVPKDPDTIIILESTANGRTSIGEPFFNFWNASVRGDTGYMPVFLSWLEDPTCVDHNLDVSDAPRDEDERILMKEFHATPQQIAWRRLTLEGPECRGYVDIFMQEYPHTPEVAFISTGEPAFTRDEMAKARASCRPPLDTGRVTIRGSTTRWESDPASLMRIWAHPQPGHRYYFGVDAARGKDEGDFSSFVGWDGETGDQVCSFADRIGPQALAAILYAVGTHYNRAMLNIELTGNLGLWAQSRLRDHYNYTNLYRWRGSRDDSVKPYRKQSSYGWETGVRSREYAMVAFRECVHNQIVTVRDEQLVQQMDLCTRKDPFERWDVEYGHDDLLMAALIGNAARHQWHPRSVARTANPLLSADEADARVASLKGLQVMPGFENTVVGMTATILNTWIKQAERKPQPERLKGI